LKQGDSRYDLIVIGAGINGAAIAREAALHGLTVLLLEQGDVGSGTSAASSRLIHGGLRYLEHAEFGLVRESLAERERLLKLAPHLVEPLALCLPVYAYGRRPLWQVRLGLALYDLLSRGLGRSLPSFRSLSRAALLEQMPGLASEGLRGGVLYFDARVTWPERLVLENVQDAVEHGARLRTYTRVTGIDVEQQAVRGVEWVSAGGERGRASAARVVNAAGPWVDRVLGPLAERRLIGGTRGSHLIVEPFPGAPATAVYAEAASDGRPFFIIPWNGLYLIGTTDERFEGDPGECDASDMEVDYLIAAAESVYPGAGIAGRVLYVQAGVRPLPYTEAGATGAITRRHLIVPHEQAQGLYSIIGGKLTTHRALAEQVLAVICRQEGRREDRQAARRCAVSPTRTLALPGTLSAPARDALICELADRFGAVQAERLWRIYGGGARDLLTRVHEQADLAEPFCAATGALAAELVHAIETEWAVTLADLLRRRTMTGWSPDFGLGAAVEAAERLRRLGIWDRPRTEQELGAYRDLALRARVRRQPALQD
jgi:glycerol-3-phosphate dehydrogenase